jgi:hypothetical protein
MPSPSLPHCRCPAAARVLLAVLLALPATHALAGLGEPRIDLLAPQRSYAVLRQALPSGTQVTQYVDRQRTVFAVAWSGPYLPELRELLGAYHRELVEAQARSTLHAPVVVRSSRIAIESATGVGSFQGRAWLPDHLPAGFDVKELR